jgi:hypothetical protein
VNWWQVLSRKCQHGKDPDEKAKTLKWPGLPKTSRKEKDDMSRKGRRTKGMEEAHPFAGMSRINPHAAGVDIGAVEIVVCVPGAGDTQIVRAFGNYTADLQAIGRWLKEHGVTTVAMESTGVYWIPLFEELGGKGSSVCDQFTIPAQGSGE